jgi:beta-mannanase
MKRDAFSHNSEMPRETDVRRRSILLGLGSLVTSQLLTGCGAGASGDPASAVANQAARVAASSNTLTTDRSAGSTTATAHRSPTTSKAASTPASKLVTGVFSGGYNPTSAEAYEKWLGKDTGYNVDFITTSSYSWDIYEWGPMKTAQPSNNMLFSVPLDNMSGIIQGTYDTVYQAMATSIAKYYPSAIIRIGWEMNGAWYDWSAANRVSTYIEAYNHVAAFFRVKSSGFLIEWCPNNGVSSNMDCLQAYPGDRYVDCIGMDTYMDYRYGTQTSAERWAYLVSNTRGLQWQVSFAKEHGKKLSIPEWGVNKDDPLFIENMYAWLTTNNYHHASYWDSNSDFQSMLSKGQYPNAAAAFKTLFGAA